MKFSKNRFPLSYRLQQKWQTFRYNYRWSDWVSYIDGWIPKFAFFFPIIGYLILFNDTFSEFFKFEKLTNKTIIESGLSGTNRLRLLYFGLFFLGISNFIFRLKKPRALKLGRDALEYSESALKYFTLGDYTQIHSRIRREGHISMEGKYYDSEWNGFLAASRNTNEGHQNVIRDGNWEEAKKQYGNMLRSILRENYYYLMGSRLKYLTACLVLSSIGYLLLIIPSIDIFIKVLRSVFYI